MKNRFDAIVVGAGPAGATAAYHLARKGFDVLLVERGRGKGSKQVFGGRIYTPLLRKALGDIDGAPIHRWVTREKVTIVDGDRVFSVEYSSREKTSFTAYLTEFTRWLIDKAVNTGAVFVDEVRIDKLLVENDWIRGVESQGDRVYADIVIDAEGANRLLLERLGLVKRATPEQMAVGVKEVIKLGEKEIEKRFSLTPGEGVSWVLMGSVTSFVPGGAFLYTNRDTVSIGLVVHLGSAVKTGLREHLYTLIEKLRLSSPVSKYVAGGDIMEYSAHVTIESGYRYMPARLVSNGLIVVGDAAGLLLNTGFTFRGVDYAVYSGYLAAEAVEKAHSEGDFSEKSLERHYVAPLKKSPLYRDLKRHRGVEKLMSDPELFKRIARIAPLVFSKIFELGEDTPTVMEALLESLRETRLSLSKALITGYKLVKTL